MSDGEDTTISPSSPSGASRPLSRSTILYRVPAVGSPTKMGVDFRSRSSACIPMVNVSHVWVSVMPNDDSCKVIPVSARQRRR